MRTGMSIIISSAALVTAVMGSDGVRGERGHERVVPMSSLSLCIRLRRCINHNRNRSIRSPPPPQPTVYQA